MNGQNYWVFGLCPLSSIPKTRECTISTFQKLNLFPSSDKGGETPTLLGLLERANLNHCKTY
jgi:hypothetical protein